MAVNKFKRKDLILVNVLGLCLCILILVLSVIFETMSKDSMKKEKLNDTIVNKYQEPQNKHALKTLIKAYESTKAMVRSWLKLGIFLFLGFTLIFIANLVIVAKINTNNLSKVQKNE